MAAGSTYFPIATTTGTGSSAVITFSAIPSTYTDLIIVLNSNTASGGDYTYRLNGDTSALYSRTQIVGNGSTAVSARDTNGTFEYLNYNGIPTTDAGITMIFNFMNYANTNVFKTGLIRAGYSNKELLAQVHLYRSTSAISTFAITKTAANFDTGTTLTLYGIQAA
jgi:hypothetical protein